MHKGTNQNSTNILRGGRLRKAAGGIVSFAPFLASASAVALGAMLAGSSPSAAQTTSTAKCTSENSDGAYVCSGIQSSDADAPETITAASGQTLAVTQDAAFGLFVDASDHNGETAMTITAESGSSGGQVDFFTRIANTTRGGGDALKIVNNSGSDITFNNLISDSHGGTASEYILSALGDAVVLEGTGAGDIIFNTDGQISTAQAQSYGTGLGGKGVEASHSGSGDLAITTGRIKTESGGINVVHSSGATGAITITANGDITAGFNYRTAQQESANMPVLTDSSADDDNSNGIEVTTATTTQGAISITANGGITSSADGIHINHYGGGAVTIVANSITATDIDADDCGVPGACRNIGNDGIRAVTSYEDGGSANFTAATFAIDVRGDIDASNDAISLNHNSGPRNVEITTAAGTTLTTTGDTADDGIWVSTGTGSGSITIAANGAIGTSSSGVGDDGIFVRHYGGDVIDVTASKIFAEDEGIQVYNYGGSATTIIANGDIYAGGVAIDVYQVGSSMLTITTNGTISSDANDGISADSLATSATITANGAIGTSSNGVGANGIDAFHSGSGIMMVTTNDIFAAGDGIRVEGQYAHSGAITINALGDINSSNDGYGIKIYQTGIGDITITTTAGKTITATADGINAATYYSSSANLIINANGNIMAQTQGIFASTASETTGNLDITASGDVTSEERGINVDHDGAGTVAVATHGTVTSNADYGIYIRTAGVSGGVTVAATGNIESDDAGILVDHNGSGDVSITASGSISTNNNGILALSYEMSGDLDITAGSLTTGDNAIDVNHEGSGNVTVAVTGNITANSSGAIGIDIYTGTTSGDVTIAETRNIESANRGINVEHYGTGTISITTGGSITSTDEEGIYVETVSTTTGNVEITANESITSEKGGIKVEHGGAGSVSIATSGAISSTTEEGIFVNTASGTAESVEITANDNITSRKEGIIVNQYTGDELAIKTYGTIISEMDEGIDVISLSTSTTITANGAIGTSSNSVGGSGIDAYHNGSGIMMITTNDIFAEGYGIRAYAYTDSSSMTINAHGNINSGSSGHGIEAKKRGSGDLTITTTDGKTITAEMDGINIATHHTSGASTIINAHGNIMAQMEGIQVDHNATGSVAITTGGNIASTAEEGIFVGTGEGMTGNVDITANGNITSGKEGIYLRHDGSGSVNITTNGDIRPTSGEEGIVVVANSASTGDVTIDINGDVVVDTDMTTNSAIFVNKESGTTHINVSESTVTSGGGSAIRVLGAADAVVTLNDGASLSAAFDAKSGQFTGTATLALAGSDTSGGNSFGLARAFSVDNFEKNGTGTWTLTGTQDQGESFTNFSVNEGRVVWDTTSNLQATSATIADGATLEITQANTQWSMASTLSGRLALTGASSSTSFGAVTASGGNIDIDVDFSGGSVTLTTARFAATSVDGTIPVNIRAMGGSVPSRQVTISNLIAVADSDAFVAGRPLSEGFTFDLQYDTTNTRWDIVAIPAETDDGNGGSGNSDRSNDDDGESGNGDGNGSGDSGGNDGGSDGDKGNGEDRNGGSGGSGGEEDGGDGNGNGGSGGNDGGSDGDNGNGGDRNGGNGGSGGEENGGGDGRGGNEGNGDGDSGGINGGIETALFEMLPVALAQLSRLESMHERIQGKKFRGEADVGMWARARGGTVEIDPGISTSPSSFETQNMALEFGADLPMSTATFGASVAFGSAESEVFSADATGDISINTIAAGLSATWRHEGFYADAQGHYVDFSSDMEADGEELVKNVGASAISAGLELGHSIDINGLQVTSSAQAWWSGIDFDDFTDTDGTTMTLNDGEVIFGRVGVLLEREVGQIVWHGYGDVIMPLDGEMTVDASGVRMLSESKEAVFDAGVGVVYDWDDGAYVGLLSISTQQGKEIEGYGVSVELKMAF